MVHGWRGRGDWGDSLSRLWKPSWAGLGSRVLLEALGGEAGFDFSCPGA